MKYFLRMLFFKLLPSTSGCVWKNVSMSPGIITCRRKYLVWWIASVDANSAFNPGSTKHHNRCILCLLFNLWNFFYGRLKAFIVHEWSKVFPSMTFIRIYDFDFLDERWIICHNINCTNISQYVRSKYKDTLPIA